MSTTTSCPHCGAVTSAGAFCTQCGQALPAAGPSGPRVLEGPELEATSAGRRRQTEQLQKTARKAAGALLGVAILQAVFGVVLQSMQPLLSPAEAVFVSALMFMILHLSVASFPHTFIMGVAAGWLCVRTRSLLPGMLLHFLHNGYCVALEWAGIL